MKLIISGSLLLFLTTLAMGVGLNTANLLQNSQFSSPISNNVKRQYKSWYERYDHWKYEEFSRWYVQTIKIGIRWLKTRGITLPRISKIVS